MAKKRKHHFTITHMGRSFDYAQESNSAFLVWMKIKPLCHPGQKVTIVDDKNNIYNYIKE